MNWVTTVPLQAYVTLSAALFAIGLLGVLIRRNAIAVLLGVELMLNAANINFVAFWRYGPSANMEGQVFAVIVMTLAAAEAAIALAIILNVYRRFKTVNVDQINLMKG
jgi:NADH-quinone oxidoreductase subunit K